MSNQEKTIKVTEQDIEIPLVKILAGRGFITGKSRSGKSNTVGKICEEILDQSYPLMVIDTEGEYYGLKESYEVLHVGADEECDLQVGAEHAEKIAELALEQNVPIILDVSGYVESEEAEKLVYQTCKKLFDKEKKLKKPFPIFVEEAHEWIPEQGSRGENGQVSEILIKICKRGGKRGLGISASTQRPASLDKDFITQTNFKFWHNLDWDNDLQVVRKVLGKDYIKTVKNLDIGEAILQSNFLEPRKQKVKVLKKQTFDAGDTPGLEDFERPELKSVSSDLVEELQQISEKKKQEQNRIQQLEDELISKDEKIEELEDELEAARQNNETVNQLADQLANIASDGEGGSEALEEIREEKNSRIRELEKENKQYQDRIEELESEVESLEEFREYHEKVKDWEEKRDVVREALLRLKDELDIEVDGDIKKYRERIKKQEQKIKELEEKVEKSTVRNKSDFIGSDRYQNLLENMANRYQPSYDAFDSVMKELNKGDATLTQLSAATGYAKSTLEQKIIRKLKQQEWVTKSGRKYSLSKEIS